MTELWVDLEGTIIPHWNDIDTYINLDKLASIIKDNEINFIGIYSYAIWNKENFDIIKQHPITDYLSKLVNGSPIEVHNTYAMGKDWESLHRHGSVDAQSTGIWKQPKEFAFLMTVRRRVELGSSVKNFILFDDTVPHKKCYTMEDGVQVKFMNPENM